MYFALEFRREVELDFRKVLLRHLQHVSGVGEEHVSALLVQRHVLHLSSLEVLEFVLVVALYPARLVERDRLPAAQGVVFVLQSVLYDFELQLSDSSDDFSSVELVDEKLRHSLVHELMYSGQIVMGKFVKSSYIILLYAVIALVYFGVNSLLLYISKRAIKHVYLGTSAQIMLN